jgi:hypothetical protein
VIARDVARVSVSDLAGSSAKPIPNAFATTVFVRRSFDLVRGGCSPPNEILMKRDVSQFNAILPSTALAAGAMEYSLAFLL